MIESYALLAIFVVQILAMSVLCPAWLIRYVRAQASIIPADRLAQMSTGDWALTLERSVTWYRWLNTAVAVLGLLPLGWLFNYTQRPDWDDGPAEALVSLYFGVQVLPLMLVALGNFRYLHELKQLFSDARRKASLQHRGLFDFVSPFAVTLAAVAYVLFVAYVLYIMRHPFPGFQGPITLGGITLVHVLNAFAIYKVLYGRRRSPFESNASRARMMSLSVRGIVYASFLCSLFLALDFTLVLLDQQRWEPFAQSVFLVICAWVSYVGFLAPPRGREALA